MKKSILATSLLLSQTAISSPTPWAELYKHDLKFIYKTLETNHPGAIDRENPWFKEQMEKGFAEGKKAASEVRNYNDYEAALSRYISGFKDGHLGLSFNLQRKVTIWPGFILARRGDAYQVVEVDGEEHENLPKLGWTLVECDGLRPDELMKKHVFPFQRGNENLEGDWQILSPYLLQGEPHPWKPKYQKCTFFDGKKNITLEITERPIQEGALIAKIKKASLGNEPRTTSRRQLKKGIEWISLPTFYPAGKEIEALKKIVSDMKTLRRSKYIIFELRGNTGGSSLWGQEILENLYGKSYIEAKAAEENSNSFAEWRVSQGNLNHLRWIGSFLKERHGENSDGYKIFAQTLKNMELAIEKGLAYARQGDPKEKPAKTPGPPLSKTRIIALTDGHCASACLDFMDLLLTLPNVTHVGTPTSADTLYMEVRSEDLPSGLGKVRFATKVYRNRKRGHNVDYKPKFRWNGDITDTRAIENWILKDIIPQLEKSM